MIKISLRWRITILMGALLVTVCFLLTILGIQNMTSNFVTPIRQASVAMENLDNTGAISFHEEADKLPEGTFFLPEVTQEIEIASRSFSSTSYIYMIFVVVGGMLATYYLAGRAMGPISKLNDEISTIDIHNLSKRIYVPQTKDEVEKLSSSFNQLLTRLEQGFEKEKRFSSNAAHELKTPLAVIMTSAQVLAMSSGVSNQEYRENLDITLQSVKRLSSVVDGLLLLGGARLDMPNETISITQMLYDIEKELAPLYSEKNITFTYKLEPIILNGSSTLLHRAFFNLVENAWKYAGEGGTVTISTCNHNERSIVSITNTGCISADDIENIFEPFYRADKSRSRKIAGAGLGLSIAKEIFDLHGAKISIHSDYESETIVDVYFQLTFEGCGVGTQD